jgi:hypothetical protein
MPQKTDRTAKIKSRGPAKSPRPASNSKRRSKRSRTGGDSDWSILCYFAGDGLLSASVISQLKGITDAGFQKDTNVLVYFDPNCNGRNARIFDVNALRKQQLGTRIGDGRDPFVRDIAEDCYIPRLPQVPAPITLRYFLEYARKYYPAKNYMLFLLGHGVIVGNDAFLPDPDDNSGITLPDLGFILKNFADKVRASGDEFHLVGFHSCSMSSIELLYELQGTARYMLGTQGAAFPGSWPYRQLLKKVLHAIDEARKGRKNTKPRKKSKNVENGTYEPDELVQNILNGLQDLSFFNTEDFWLAGYSSDLAMCSLDINKVGELHKPIEDLSRALRDGLSQKDTKDSIQLAHLESQAYWKENYTDLIDFCECLSARCQGRSKVERTIKTACQNVKLTLEDGAEKIDRIIVASDYYGPAYQFSNGLSIYFPWKRPVPTVMQSYKASKFTRDHGRQSWLSFLNEYFIATRRNVRKTKSPRRTEPDPDLMQWRSTDNLLRTLSDRRLLSLGPERRKIPGNLSEVGDDMKKVGRELEGVGQEFSKVGSELEGKIGGELSQLGSKLKTRGKALSKVGSELSNEGGKLSGKTGGELAHKVSAELATVAAELSKVGAELDGKLGSELEGKVSAEPADKVGAELTKLLGELSKVGGELSKVGGELAGTVEGELSKVGSELAEGAGMQLSKVGGELSKVGSELSKVGGDLSIKVGGELSKVGAELEGKVGGELEGKVGGELEGKVGAEVGGFYGHTILKNFETPEYLFVASRSQSIRRNPKKRRPRARAARAG